MPRHFLSEIKDNRRKEGQRYKSGDIPLFSIFAVTGGAVSYGKIHTFIKGRYEVPGEESGHERNYTTVRNIIGGLSSEGSEGCFRKYSPELSEKKSEKIFTACDGKTLRGSSDNFNDKKAIRLPGAFFSGKRNHTRALRSRRKDRRNSRGSEAYEGIGIGRLHFHL